MSKKIIVNKFGGGILKPNLIPFIEKRLREQIKKDYSPVVVVSALPGITDKLISFIETLREHKNENIIENFVQEIEQIHKEAIISIGINAENQEKIERELAPVFTILSHDLNVGDTNTSKFEDKIIAYGERLSSIIFSFYFNSIGLKSQRFGAEDLPITTDNNFKNANIIYKISEKNVKSKIGNIKDIVVIPGFTGVTTDGEITTLGRGGTDTTACFIGAVLKAEKVILWKDVGGVLSADPKIVKEAKTIPFISYQEAEEAGKIIHDKAIQYPKMFGTAVEIASLSDPKLNTQIGQAKNIKKGTKIVSYKKNLTLLLLTDEIIKGNELLSIVSEIFFKNKIDVILISNTRYSLQIVVDNTNLSDKIIKELNHKIYKVESYKVSMVFLVGKFDVNDVNTFNELLIKLKTDLEISAFLYKNCTRLEAVIKTDQIEGVVKALYKKFIR